MKNVLLSFVTFLCFVVAEAQPHVFNDPIVLGYFPSWSETFAVQDQNSTLREVPSFVNYVFLAFAKPDLVYTKGSYDISQTGIQVPYDGCTLYESVNALKDKGVNVILSVGGETYWTAGTEANINYQMIKDLVDDMGFVGIDWDYEPNGSFTDIGNATNVQHYIDFFNNSRALMPRADGYVLACAPSGVGALGGQTNDDAASPYEYAERNNVTGEDDTNLFNGTAQTNGINLFGYSSTGHMIPVMQAVGDKIDIIAFQGYNVGGSLNRTIMYDAYAYYAEQYGFKLAAGTHFPDEAWGPHFEYTHDNVGDLAEHIYTHADRAGKKDGVMIWQMLLDDAPTRTAYSYLNVGYNVLNGVPKANAVTNAMTYSLDPYTGGALVCGAATPVRNTINREACDSYTSPSGKYTLTVSGVYEDTLVGAGAGGVDSILTINLTMGYKQYNSFPVEACGDSYISPSGKNWTTPGTYKDTIPTTFGCDSLLTIDLTFLPTTTRTLRLFGCDSIVAPSGTKTWYNAGIYRDTVSCDSIYIVYAGITKTQFIPKDELACGSYVSPSGKIWTTSGTYHDTLTALSTGCDSVLVINLTIDSPRIHDSTMVGCGRILSPSEKFFMTESGTYRDTVFSLTQACDSVLDITAIVYDVPNVNVDTMYCLPIASPSGLYTWDSTGVYYDTLTTINGCDSIIISNVEIGKVDTSIRHVNHLLVSGADFAKFQWLDCWDNYSEIPGEIYKDYSVVRDGSYAVEVDQYNCIDTSACWDVILSDVALLQHVDFNAELRGSNVQINLGQAQKVMCTITSVNGNVIHQEMITSSGLINLENFATGLYIVKLATDNKQEVLRVVVE